MSEGSTVKALRLDCVVVCVRARVCVCGVCVCVFVAAITFTNEEAPLLMKRNTESPKCLKQH